MLAVFQPKGLSEHYVVAMVTSRLNGVLFPVDTWFAKWREAGLPKASMVRLAKVVTVERSLIRKKLGTVQASDRPPSAASSGKFSPNWFEVRRRPNSSGGSLEAEQKTGTRLQQI
jgi:hypothetical protein